MKTKDVKKKKNKKLLKDYFGTLYPEEYVDVIVGIREQETKLGSMETSWELLQKELAFYGIRLLAEDRCQFFEREGLSNLKTLARAIADVKKDTSLQVETFRFIWRQIAAILGEQSAGLPSGSADHRSLMLFAHSIQGLARLVDTFEDLDNTALKKVIHQSLATDIVEFSPTQLRMLPNYKIALDWTFREINHGLYVVDLLRAAISGQSYVESLAFKTAKGEGIGGPWSNLDLPMLERVWPWQDEDENLRGRSKDIRRQRRYRMGLENYNNDGNVGEGFYWREIRNEPFSWYTRSSDDPYYNRYVLNRN